MIDKKSFIPGLYMKRLPDKGFFAAICRLYSQNRAQKRISISELSILYNIQQQRND